MFFPVILSKLTWTCQPFFRSLSPTFLSPFMMIVSLLVTNIPPSLFGPITVKVFAPGSSAVISPVTPKLVFCCGIAWAWLLTARSRSATEQSTETSAFVRVMTILPVLYPARWPRVWAPSTELTSSHVQASAAHQSCRCRTVLLPLPCRPSRGRLVSPPERRSRATYHLAQRHGNAGTLLFFRLWQQSVVPVDADLRQGVRLDRRAAAGAERAAVSAEVRPGVRCRPGTGRKGGGRGQESASREPTMTRPSCSVRAA